jgi:hypothetical protein
MVISESQLRQVCRNTKQKYEAFQRNGFVLPTFTSSIVNNLYLDKVSIQQLTTTACMVGQGRRDLDPSDFFLEALPQQ